MSVRASAKSARSSWGALVLLATVAACGGSEFSAADDAAEAGSSSGASGGTRSGSGGSSGRGQSGGGSSNTGGSNNTGGSGSAVAGCVEYVEAYCAWAERCDQYLYGGSLGACTSIAEARCAWLELPGVAITGDDYRRCAGDYTTANCTAVDACELPDGTIENGFACATAVQCESGYCTGGNGACGICAPNPRHPVGGECENPLVDCEAELDCVDSVCTPKRTEGELCDDSHHCETVVELGAMLCVEGTCTVVALPGEQCPTSDSGTPFCGYGTACTTENVCVLSERGEEGDVCGTFADRVVVCPNGACVADPDAPEVARCMNWAGAGESCRKVPNFERCATGLECRDSICAWPKIPEPPQDCE